MKRSRFSGLCLVLVLSLSLLLCREYVNDTVNGLASIVGMQSTEYQKTGFCRGKGK